MRGLLLITMYYVVKADSYYEDFEMENYYDTKGTTPQEEEHTECDWAEEHAKAIMELMRKTVNETERLEKKMREKCGITGELDVG